MIKLLKTKVALWMYRWKPLRMWQEILKEYDYKFGHGLICKQSDVFGYLWMNKEFREEIKKEATKFLEEHSYAKAKVLEDTSISLPLFSLMDMSYEQAKSVRLEFIDYMIDKHTPEDEE
jgi:hypothetical protein